MDSNHFVVKAKGKIPVDVYFAQANPLTCCVCRITQQHKKGKEVKHIFLGGALSFCNPTDTWDEWIGKQKAFGRMKEWMKTHDDCSIISFKRDLPNSREFERAYWEWYSQFKEE